VSSFIVGKNYSKNIVTVKKPNITIDGSGAKIIFETDEEINTDTNLFFIANTAKNVVLKKYHN
jgi:predicted transposase YbfD/YdcC